MSDRYMKQDIAYTMSHSIMFVTDLCVCVWLNKLYRENNG